MEYPSGNSKTIVIRDFIDLATYSISVLIENLTEKGDKSAESHQGHIGSQIKLCNKGSSRGHDKILFGLEC